MCKPTIASSNTQMSARPPSRERRFRTIAPIALLASLVLNGAAIAAEPVGPDLTEKLRGVPQPLCDGSIRGTERAVDSGCLGSRL